MVDMTTGQRVSAALKEHRVVLRGGRTGPLQEQQIKVSCHCGWKSALENLGRALASHERHAAHKVLRVLAGVSD